MAKAMRLFSLVTVAMALVVCSVSVHAQVYSYLDVNGVRVFTNIPPSGAVSDLKISGAPPAPPPAKLEASRKTPPIQPKVSASKTATAAKNGNRNLANEAGGAAADPQALSQPNCDSTDYDAIIIKYANEFHLDPKLIRSMIVTESGYNPRAVSPKGAQGLMQLMPETAARLGVSHPFDPEENIWGGARYMRFLLDTFAENPAETLTLSLAAYNAGENLVQRLGRIPAIRETNDYVRSIIQRYGSNTMAVPSNPATPAVGPTTYHYFDNGGILVLTNIPPVDRMRNANLNPGSNSIFR